MRKKSKAGKKTGLLLTPVDISQLYVACWTRATQMEGQSGKKSNKKTIPLREVEVEAAKKFNKDKEKIQKL